MVLVFGASVATSSGKPVSCISAAMGTLVIALVARLQGSLALHSENVILAADSVFGDPTSIPVPLREPPAHSTVTPMALSLKRSATACFVASAAVPVNEVPLINHPAHA